MCKSQGTFRCSFALACLDNQPMRTAATGGYVAQTFLEAHWKECVPRIRISSTLYEVRINFERSSHVLCPSEMPSLGQSQCMLVVHIRSPLQLIGFRILIPGTNITMSQFGIIKFKLFDETICFLFQFVVIKESLSSSCYV